MNHRNNLRKFSRPAPQRKALFMNLSIALLKHGRINTTLAKAKDLRRVVEKLITLAKTDSVHGRRLAFARLRDRAMVTKLFNEIAPNNLERKGGYTRVLKNGIRKGDKAPMAVIELVDR